MYYRSLRPLDGVTFLLLIPKRLAQAVARAKFHRLVAGNRFGRTEAVVLQIAVTVLVEQKTAFTATGLGEQQSGAGHASRMVLHELHIAQRHPVPIGQRHAIAGDDATVGVFAEHTPRAAGGDNDRSGFDHGEFTRCNGDRDHALRTTVLDQQVDAKMFVEALDRRILERSLEQRVQHVKTGSVGSEPGAFNFHTAECAHVDMSIRFAAPWTSPMFQLHHLLGAMGNKIIDDVLLAQPVAAGHGVVKVVRKAVVRLHYAGRTTFGRHGVTAHRVDLRNKCDGQCRIEFGNCNGRAQTGTACTNNGNIRIKTFHNDPGDLRDAQSATARASTNLPLEMLAARIGGCKSHPRRSHSDLPAV